MDTPPSTKGAQGRVGTSEVTQLRRYNHYVPPALQSPERMTRFMPSGNCNIIRFMLK
ncbi:MAG: hypothetical protein JWM37_91 [Candidatus Saccharibacteria bacterium]|nr:hypothetical protein [Candidatus Saccharibacteria bacterium]